MQIYLFIGGEMDSLSAPLPDEPESIKLPDNVLNKSVYVRDTLAVGDVSITFYRDESLTPAQALDAIVAHY